MYFQYLKLLFVAFFCREIGRVLACMDIGQVKTMKTLKQLFRWLKFTICAFY